MRAGIFTDITAGGAGHNIAVTLVQLSCRFFQSRTVRAVS